MVEPAEARSSGISRAQLKELLNCNEVYGYNFDTAQLSTVCSEAGAAEELVDL